MSRVKSKNTKPEKIMFSMLKEADYKFKKHYPIIGRPDMAFQDYKVAVFIDGEFWHGKDFNDWKSKLSAFWYKKITENVCRDKKSRSLLRAKGWHIMRLWGREIVENPDKSVEKLKKFIKKNRRNN